MTGHPDPPDSPLRQVALAFGRIVAALNAFWAALIVLTDVAGAWMYRSQATAGSAPARRVMLDRWLGRTEPSTLTLGLELALGLGLLIAGVMCARGRGRSNRPHSSV